LLAIAFTPTDRLIYNQVSLILEIPHRQTCVRIGKIHVVPYKLSQQRRVMSLSRNFSWLSQNRRMSKDYERLPESSEALVYVAMSRLMVRRLATS